MPQRLIDDNAVQDFIDDNGAQCFVDDLGNYTCEVVAPTQPPKRGHKPAKG